MGFETPSPVLWHTILPLHTIPSSRILVHSQGNSCHLAAGDSKPYLPSLAPPQSPRSTFLVVLGISIWRHHWDSTSTGPAFSTFILVPTLTTLLSLPIPPLEAETLVST